MTEGGNCPAEPRSVTAVTVRGLPQQLSPRASKRYAVTLRDMSGEFATHAGRR
jgi:hypothetical protein